MTPVSPRRRLRRWAALLPRRRPLILKGLVRWVLLLAGILVFAQLAYELHHTRQIWLDKPVMQWLRQLRTPILTRWMERVTLLGDGWLLAVATIAGSVAMARLRHPRSAIYLVVVGLGAGALTHLLKWLFARERPDLLLRLAPAGGFAFPSGHAMGSAAVYGALAIVLVTRFPHIRGGAVLLCSALITLVGLSRAYLHVHFPSDVLAGWALGLTWPLWIKPLVLGRGLPAPAHSAQPAGAEQTGWAIDEPVYNEGRPSDGRSPNGQKETRP